MHNSLFSIFFAIALVVSVNIPNISAAAPASESIPVSKPDLKNKLLFLRDGAIWTYDVEKKTEIPLIHNSGITNYAISSDASKITFLKDHKKLYLYDVITSSEEFIMETPTDASQPSLSPHGEKIALIGYTKEKVEVRFNYFTEPVKQHVRHVWLIDVKTKKVEDVTQDIPYQHSQVHWSPDGRWLSFASYRFGLLDKLNPFSNKNWSVYLMDLSDSTHKTIEIGGGMSSSWLNKDQVVVSEGVAANILSIYDVPTKTKKPVSMFQAGFSAPEFSFGGANNEVVYYEVILDPDGNGLIRYHNVQTDKTEDVIKNASIPRYVK